MFLFEQPPSRSVAILSAMNGQIPPVLYSADLSGCAGIAQLTESEISEIFTLVLQSAGATIVHAHSHVHGETALTCAVILTESHAVLHTWRETGTVNIDIFCCSTRLKALEAIENLQWLLGARSACVQEMPRGERPQSSEQH
ncbi:MAG: S-adenosylmethionine decarboxylase [Vicinamibacterales bacterium]